MAIIVCPECGEKVSDKAMSCVHCGCKLFICPECGSVNTEKLEICPECGYCIKEEDEEDEGAPDGIRKIISSWKNQSMVCTLTNGRFVFWIALLPAAMFFFAIGSIINWQNGDMVMNYESTRFKMKLFFILGGVFIMLGSSNCLVQLLKVSSLLRWNAVNRMDLKKVLIEAYGMNFQKNSFEENVELGDVLDTCSWAALYSENVFLREKHKNQRVLQIFLSLLFSVSITIFLISNALVYMEAEFWASDLLDIEGFSFSMIKHWWLLIVGCMSFLIGEICNTVTEKSRQAERDEWIKKNAPEQFETHKKYVRDRYAYIVQNRSAHLVNKKLKL